MSNRAARCFICGRALGVPLALLGRHGLVAAECVACLGREVGHAALAFRFVSHRLAGPSGGVVLITRAAAGALAEAGLSAADILDEHSGAVGGPSGDRRSTPARRAVSDHSTPRGRVIRAVTVQWADGPVTTLGIGGGD